MAGAQVIPPFPVFTDVDGNPVDDGYIFVGTEGLDPIASPVPVFWDRALTVPATQPIRTIGGYPSNLGVRSVFYSSSAVYSILVRNKNGTAIYSDSSFASSIGWKRNLLDGAINTVEQMLDAQAVSIWEFANLITSKPSNNPSTWDWTPALVGVLAAGGNISIPKLDYILDGAALFALTGKNYFEVISNTLIDADIGARFRINSNQLADGTRVEITGTNVRINNLELNETNAVLTRSNVYGTLAGKGCQNVVLDNVTVDGANGAGMHFRNNSAKITLIKPKVINTKSDGIHVQRGSNQVKMISPFCVGNEDDCIGLASHGRNEGYAQVSEVEIIGGYYGPQANGAVGSGIAVIGAINVRIVSPQCVSNGLSSIRVTDFISAPEGSYVSEDVTIISPECYFGGQTSSGVGGLVKDGITVLNSKNVRVNDAYVLGPIGNGIVVSGASIDVNISVAAIHEAGGRGFWVASAFSSAAHILEMAAGDARYSAPAQLGTEYLRSSKIYTDESFNDGIYIDGGASNTIINPVFNDLQAARSNRGNTAGKFGVRIANTVGMSLDGISGGLQHSGSVAINPIQYATAGYTRISRADIKQISTSFPTFTHGDSREFWNTAIPAGAPAAGGDYKIAERVRNTNASSNGSVTEWSLVTPSAGAAGTWRPISWIVGRAVTASRPTLTSSDIGVMFLDTTLAAAGKPIWWTGTAWVDATGTVV